MRTVRLRQPLSRRFTALGLGLSMGLILVAGQVIGSGAPETGPDSANREETVAPADDRPARESPGASRAVHGRGHREADRSLRL